MKKLVALLGILVLGVVLTGCTEAAAEVTPPTLTSFKIDDMAAKDGADLVTFYRGKNQTIEMDLVISNPSNLEITSIVINGYNHRVAYFKDTSTTRRVIFDLDVGTNTGELVFSIDEIKYTNGDNTERAIVSGENEFKVYIFKELPTIERDGFSLGQDYITLAFTKTDIDNVFVDGTLRAELYSGESTKETILITDDMESVTFTGLLSSNTYEMRFVANYDLDDNEGVKEDVILYSGEFSTQQKAIPSAKINNVFLEGSKVTFDVEYTDENGVIIEDGLTVQIYEGEEFVASAVIISHFQQLVFDGVDGINNNSTYSIKVMADYNLLDGLGVKTGNVLASGEFTTPSKSVPAPMILELNIQENLVSFDVAIADPEALLIEDTLIAHIYVNETFIDSSPIINNHVDFQITNLFANELFEIRITSSYDLNDGEGVHTDAVIYSEEFTTNTNLAPVVDVTDVSLRQGYVKLDLTVRDEFDTLKGDVMAILKEDGEIVGTPIYFNKDVAMIEFEYLVTYTSVYTVEISADYNLRDGNGTKINEILFSNVIVTVEKKSPVAELRNEVIENDSITFNVRLMDADDTIQPNTTLVYLYKDGVVDPDHAPFAAGFNDPEITFLNLESNHDYKIVVKSVYDLLDGTLIFEPQTIFEGTYKTLEKEVPTAVLQDIESETGSVTVDVVITDVDEVIVPGTMFAYLYKDGLQVGLGTPLLDLVSPNVTFSGLLSANTYTVKVEVNYDLNNGEPVFVDQLLTESTIQTIEKDAPVALIEVISESNNEIVIDVELFDTDTVINGVARVELYVDETLHGTIDNLIIGMNSNLTFTDVQSDTRFTVRVIASYDLNDGEDPVVNEILNNEAANTTENEIPTAEYIGSVLGKDTITFDVFVIDPNNVHVPTTLVAELIKDGVSTDITIPLAIGLNENKVFSGLLADSEYTIVIKTDYNLNDGGITIPNLEMDSFIAITEKLFKPTASISVVNELNKELEFDITVADPDATISGATVSVLYAELFVDGVTTTLTENLIVGDNPGISFEGLDYGTQYELRIMTIYNLNDGGSDVPIEAIGAGVASTKDLIYITNFNEQIRTDLIHPLFDLSEIYVSFNINVIDTFLILDSADLEFILYKEDTTQVGLSQVVYSSFDMELLNLQFGNKYYFEITATVNLGAVTVTEVVYTQEFETMKSVAPSIGLSNVTIDQHDVVVGIDIIDSFNTLRGQMTAQLLEDGAVVSTILFDKDDNAIMFDYVAKALSEYRIEISTSYDLGDGSGLTTDEEIFSRVILTVEKKEPDVAITSIIPAFNQLTFDLEILDIDGTVTANTGSVLLFDEDGVHVLTLPYTTGLETMNFGTLTAGKTYHVVVMADYNLDDGSGEQTSNILYEQSISTIDAIVPTATISNPIVTLDTVTIDIDVVDTDGIIDGTASVALYLDGVLYDTITGLSVGSNTETFTAVQSNTSFTANVIASYNMNDGNPAIATVEISADTTVETLEKAVPTAELTNPIITKNSVTIDIEVTDTNSVIDGTASVALYLDGAHYATITGLSVGSNTETFNTVQSNSIFTVKVIASYNLDDGSVAIVNEELTSDTAITLENELPSATYISSVLTKDSITFNVTVVDTDDVILPGTLIAELFKDGVTTLRTLPLVVGSNPTELFDGLESNATYTIVVKTNYNLKEGTSDITNSQLVSFDNDFAQLAIPSADITITSEFNTELVFNIEVMDDDITIGVGALFAELYLNGAPTGMTENLNVGSNPGITFSGLPYGTSYEVRVFATYNVNEGMADVPLDTIGTKAASTKDLIYITNFADRLDPDMINPLIDLSQNYVSFDIDVIDTFGILVNPNLVFNLYDASFAPVGLSQVIYSSFEMEILNLQFNNTYTYEITATVDLGAGPVTEVVYSGEFTTMASTKPSITVGDVELSQQNMLFDVGIDNAFDTLRGQLTAKLFEDGVVVATVYLDDTDTVLEFDHVAAFDKEYRVEITASYNLGDGAGLTPNEEIFSRVILVVVKNEPSSEVTNLVSLFDELTFDLEILDIDGTVTTDGTVSLYDETGALVLALPYTTGIINYNFGSLLSGKLYTVKVVADYNVDDGSGLQTGNVIFEQEIATMAATVPQAVYSNPVITSNSITIDIDVLDPDLIIKNAPHSLYAYAYEEGVQVGPAVMVTVGSNTYVFPGLFTTTDIEIVVSATYNLNEGTADIVDEILESKGYTTLENVLATGEMTLNTEKHNEIIVDVTIIDPDGVIVSNLRAEIYNGETMIGASQPVVVGANTITFTDLAYGETFIVKILGDVDMYDGDPIAADTEFANEEYATLPLVTISGFAEEKLNSVSTPAATPSEVYVGFTISVSEYNAILSSNDLLIQLYKSDDLVTPIGATTVSQSTADVQFFNLLFNTEYVYTVTATVDHGAGDVSDVVYTETFSTSIIVVPITAIVDVIPTVGAITFSIEDMTDDDTVIVSNLRVVLIKDGVEVSSSALVGLTGHTGLTFAENGQDASEYEIVVLATLNYQDGAGDLDDQVLATHTYIYAN